MTPDSKAKGETMTDIRISRVVQQVVKMLVEGDYVGLEKLSHGNWLNAHEISQVIKDYNVKMVMPPQSAFQDLDIIEVENAESHQWSVRFNLWTTSEGRSDLSLELTVKEVSQQKLEFEIDNIHTL